MAAPTTITETGLKTYLHSVLDTAISSFLSWSVAGGSYDTIAEDALLEYGLEDISDISTMAQVKLMRACGRLCMWRKVVSATIGFHDSDNYEMELKYSQINKQARAAMLDEEGLVRDARSSLETGGMSGCRIYSISRTDDPFTAQDEEDEEDEYAP